MIKEPKSKDWRGYYLNLRKRKVVVDVLAELANNYWFLWWFKHLFHIIFRYYLNHNPLHIFNLHVQILTLDILKSY